MRWFLFICSLVLPAGPLFAERLCNQKSDFGPQTELEFHRVDLVAPEFSSDEIEPAELITLESDSIQSWSEVKFSDGRMRKILCIRNRPEWLGVELIQHDPWRDASAFSLNWDRARIGRINIKDSQEAVLRLLLINDFQFTSHNIGRLKVE